MQRTEDGARSPSLARSIPQVNRQSHPLISDMGFHTIGECQCLMKLQHQLLLLKAQAWMPHSSISWDSHAGRLGESSVAKASGVTDSPRPGPSVFPSGEPGVSGDFWERCVFADPGVLLPRPLLPPFPSSPYTNFA